MSQEKQSVTMNFVPVDVHYAQMYLADPDLGMDNPPTIEDAPGKFLAVGSDGGIILTGLYTGAANIAVRTHPPVPARTSRRKSPPRATSTPPPGNCRTQHSPSTPLHMTSPARPAGQTTRLIRRGSPCLMLAKSPVVMPIPGSSRPGAITDSVAAADLALTPAEVAELDAA